MIPAALAILIYQVLAILGTEAVSQIVTSIAYKKRDLDFKLMYLQSPLDLALHYKKFNQTTARKLSIVLLTCLTLVLKFIPTIMTKLSSTALIYYDTTITPLDQTTATSIYNWPSTMPVFDNFVPYLANPNTNSLQDILSTYIKEKLNQNITSNDDGHWFTPNIARRFEWNDQQVARSEGFHTPLPANVSIMQAGPYGIVLIANWTASAFGYAIGQDSFTTSMCSPSMPGNVDRNFSNVHGIIKWGFYEIHCTSLF